MRFREILRFALRGLGANRLRSALTTLGVLIGVGAVILLVAVGNGSAQQVQENIERLGTNSLTIFSGQLGPSTSGETQSQDTSLTVDVAALLADQQGAPDVKSVTPEVNGQASGSRDGESVSVDVVGTYPSYFEASNSPVGAGTYFTNDDVLQARKVAVIGATVAEGLFGEDDPVGERISIDGSLFTVVGVLEDKGSEGFQDANSVLVAPLTTVQQSLTGYGALSSIVVQATSPDTVDAAEAEVSAILDREFDVTDPTEAPYQILNQAELLSASSDTTRTFTVLLGAVAAISLVVGGIGITNIMLVTVTERTREIGIRKAVGARRGAILGQFLTEATILSAVGGLLGVAAGVIGSRFTIAGVQPIVVPGSIALALAVAVVIGLFFGSYPANRAGIAASSRSTPIRVGKEHKMEQHPSTAGSPQWPSRDDDLRSALTGPGKGKRSLFTLVLAAVVIVAVGFIGGVLVGRTSSEPSAQAQFPGDLGQGAPDFGGGAALPNAEDGSVSFGTIESIDGDTISISTADGTTVQVRVTDGTQIQVTEEGSITDLTEGSTIVVDGSQNGDTIDATSISEGGGGFPGGGLPAGDQP